jgi:ABC-2 type transport system permease protein
MGAATWWDPLVAVASTLAATAGPVVLGGRVYSQAIMHTGPRLKLGEAWHGRPARASGPAPLPAAPSGAVAADGGDRVRPA